MVVAVVLVAAGGALMSKLAVTGTAITHRDRLPSSSRYELLVKIASGGMATVYVGRLSSVVGTSRLVAIKRAHAHLLEDPMFSKMLIAEAKLASRIHHPNVVAVQNVEEVDGELLLVMDYVEGASLADLAGDDEVPIPARVAVRALLDACAGLHAAHELTDDDGRPLGIVHRDVSPHNILVGVDGVCRITDFGIAKSSGHTGGAAHTTTGALKGKVSYMAPEYIEHGSIDARGDVFSLGVVAWEALTRQRLFRGATEIESLKLVLTADVPKPSEIAPWLGRALDKVITKALARDPRERFTTASDLGDALEEAARRDDLIATANQVGKHVRAAAGTALSSRRVLLRERPSIPDVEATPPPRSEPSVVPRGREDNTSSLRADVPDHGSVVRPRTITSTARLESPLALGPGGTLPLGAQVPVAPLAPPSEPSVDSATFGSGVSAHLVGEVRDLRQSRRRSPVVVWSAVMAFVALGAVGAGLTLHRQPRAAAPAPPLAASTPTSAPLPTTTLTPLESAAASSPSAAPSIAASARLPLAIPPSPGKAAPKPGRGVVAPSHPAPAPAPTDPPAPTPDRAPPNPYAR